MDEYNIISLGDHCAIPGILKDLGLRKYSYPFDWVAKLDNLHDTNVIYNVNIMAKMTIDNANSIADEFIGDAFTQSTKVNSKNNIWFPHDTEDVAEVFVKYERRFNRLYNDLNKKNIFMLLTRVYVIDEEAFDKILEQLLSYNNKNKILFISGTNHEYFKKEKYNVAVIFKYIHYDAARYYNYDYCSFRPAITEYLKSFFSVGK